MSRTIRRPELRRLVPLSNTTLYEMERRGEFPRRFSLSARCVVWDLAEVEAWLEGRKSLRAALGGASGESVAERTADTRTRRLSSIPGRRTLGKKALRSLVPLSETSIYDLERRGEFPARFNLSPRCVVWDAEEVEAWVAQRKVASRAGASVTAPAPDVRRRRWRPVNRPESAG